ncbi:MAG: hypothetical protein HY395_00860 [Candidatus Doudnabacteria bacterium]|nr:hypothetical protein [Candidatus Doudnabacteria bacterium]
MDNINTATLICTPVCFIGKGRVKFTSVISSTSDSSRNKVISTLTAAKSAGIIQDFKINSTGTFVEWFVMDGVIYKDLKFFVNGIEPKDKTGDMLLNAAEYELNGQTISWVGQAQ